MADIPLVVDPYNCDRFRSFSAAYCNASDTLVARDFDTTSGNQMTLNRAHGFPQLVGQKLGRKPRSRSGQNVQERPRAGQRPFFRRRCH
jgi:hypothetical protein